MAAIGHKEELFFKKKKIIKKKPLVVAQLLFLFPQITGADYQLIKTHFHVIP